MGVELDQSSHKGPSFTLHLYKLLSLPLSLSLSLVRFLLTFTPPPPLSLSLMPQTSYKLIAPRLLRASSHAQFPVHNDTWLHAEFTHTKGDVLVATN